MCTFITAVAPGEQPGLFVVFNRDEMLDRPSAPPELMRREGMRILAPRDLEAGGSWLGLNERGVFAALTNRFGLTSMDHHRSRGLVVFDALQFDGAAEAVQMLREMDPGRHNGFHLLVADEEDGFVVWNDTQRLRSKRLDSGIHVFTERSFGAGESRRLNELQQRVDKLEGWTDETVAKLVGWMRQHCEGEPLESTCVHLPQRNYGTRSSTIVQLGPKRRFAHAEGPPCQTEYGEYDELLERLLRRP